MLAADIRQSGMKCPKTCHKIHDGVGYKVKHLLHSHRSFPFKKLSIKIFTTRNENKMDSL